MKKKTPPLVSTAILTVITIFIWIGYSVYKILTQQPPINVPPEILAPLDPSLDREVLATLTTKTYFEEGQVPETFVGQGEQINQEFSITTAPVLTISPSPTQEATSPGQLTPTP